MYLNPIDKKIFNYILNKINIMLPSLRNSKYTNEYYLTKIFFILKTGCSFRDTNSTTIKNHYSAIHKKYVGTVELSPSGLIPHPNGMRN
jgi:bifunctional N-acetylglucosamine-1-phosphate-uridyltransferase/glucosamine-1-phosphate-acetyltransferase GlmU-like protein